MASTSATGGTGGGKDNGGGSKDKSGQRKQCQLHDVLHEDGRVFALIPLRLRGIVMFIWVFSKTTLYSKPPNLAKSSLAKPLFSDCLEKGQVLKFSDFLSYLSNVPRYAVPPPTRSEPIACLFGCDVSPTVPPAFPLNI
ncbi:hypothetical protein E2C01_032475 [Portunus trituberculatus]|uniref:Uncharacterized protein n=1 Tax=Portunus trituberculatus TaxID=210409 RepID=A0A5B7EZQ3_PORTR|nr:hypothetical protein [Portunus trituberculatus]